jgi:hypothetical protein
MTRRSVSGSVRINTAVLLAWILTACSGTARVSEQDRFGPLAVIEDTGGGQSDALGGTGLVIIDQRCVELDVQGTRRLLAWRSGDVRWDSVARSIVFTSRGEQPIVISNGTNITAGGEDLATDDPAGGGNATVAGVRWLAAPDDQCSTDVFIVHSIRTGR